MKKLLLWLVVFLFTLLLVSCDKKEMYKVGATPVPHAEILRFAQPIMEEKGYSFEIVEFTDYVLPNRALNEEEIIANFYQHIPFLNAQIKDYEYDFFNVGEVHVEPIGLYSKTYDSLEDLPMELELVISSSQTDRPRLLGMLEENGFITLYDDVEDVDISNASLSNLQDLYMSEYTITFIEVDSSMLFRNYVIGSGDAVLINGNYALDNGLNPLEDAICLEGSASLYVNILVTNTIDKDNPFVIVLIEVLQSDAVREFIIDTYGGSVIPVN